MVFCALLFVVYIVLSSDCTTQIVPVKVRLGHWSENSRLLVRLSTINLSDAEGQREQRKQLTESELPYNVMLVYIYLQAVSVSRTYLRPILTKDLNSI